MSDTRKADLRNEMKCLLKAAGKEEKESWDRCICERVMALPAVMEAEWIYSYMSLPWEAGTKGLIESLLKAGKRVALPKVAGQDMDFFEIRSVLDLEEGAYHIPEPSKACPKAFCEDAFMLVPGMAFTKDGKRLGKGGGYYDKFLKREPEHETAALAYEFQMVDVIPTEEHDKAVGMVVTERCVYKNTEI